MSDGCTVVFRPQAPQFVPIYLLLGRIYPGPHHDHELLKFNFDEGYKLALVWLLFKKEKF